MFHTCRAMRSCAPILAAFWFVSVSLPVSAADSADKSSTAPVTVQKKETPVLDKYTADTVIATVGSARITLGDLLLSKMSLPPQMQGVDDQALFDGLSEQVMDEFLLSTAGRAEKMDKTPKFAMLLKAQERNLLAQTYIRSKVEPLLTEESIKARYEKEVSKMPQTEEIHARHILVQTEAEAQDIVKALEKGEDFAKLAKEKTKDPSGAGNGGDLGWFTAESMVPEFSEVAFKLEKGKTSAPVKTSFGWHVIRLEDRRTKAPPTLAQVHDQVRQQLARELAEAEIKKLRSASKVERAPVLPPTKAIREDKLLEK